MLCFTIRAKTWRSFSFSSLRIASSNGLICAVGAGRFAKTFDLQVVGQIDEDRDDDIGLPFAALGGRVDGLERFVEWMLAVDENG